MNYKFVNRPAVAEDLKDVVDYYKNISPHLAKQFLFRIREAKSYVSQYPQGFQVKYKNIRTVLLKQFPYHIHYFVDENNQQIVILAIIHTYRNPKDYSKR